MTNEQLLARLTAFFDHFKTDGLKVVEQMALTGQSLIQDRIQSKGVTGAKYSDTKVPLFFVSGKNLNKKGEKFTDKQKGAGKDGKDGFVSYKDVRHANGLQTEFVDLTFSGRMFGGTRLLSTENEGNEFTANVGGTDQEVDNKLGWNVERYGPDTFSPTKEEQAEIDEIALDLLEGLLDDLTNE